jgi:hypothetical protein
MDHLWAMLFKVDDATFCQAPGHMLDEFNVEHLVLAKEAQATLLGAK